MTSEEGPEALAFAFADSIAFEREERKRSTFPLHFVLGLVCTREKRERERNLC